METIQQTAGINSWIRGREYPTTPKYDIIAEVITLYRIYVWFPYSICQQGRLTAPDTWSPPFAHLHMFYLWRTIFSPKLIVIFRILHFKHSLVLSPFYFVIRVFCRDRFITVESELFFLRSVVLSPIHYFYI